MLLLLISSYKVIINKNSDIYKNTLCTNLLVLHDMRERERVARKRKKESVSVDIFMQNSLTALALQPGRSVGGQHKDQLILQEELLID